MTHGRGNSWACSLLVQVLRSNLCPHFSGFLPGPLRALLQVPDVFLDGCQQVDTGVSAFLVRKLWRETERIVQRMSRDGFDHL